MSSRTSKRIDPNAYNALADALAVIYWNKKPWGRYLRGVLRDQPELLSGLDFEGETKREVAGQLIERLMAEEQKYQATTISLMVAVANMDRFPNLEGQQDRTQLIAEAQGAVADLKVWTERHQDLANEHQEQAREILGYAEATSRNRAFSASLQVMKQQFLEMHSSAEPQKRGKKFEAFLNQLFGLFDLEPRAAYSLAREQIDGAFTFDTDDYVLEARWWKKPIGRGDLDVFSRKISRKGKNALGLYASINGFTKDALEEYSSSTPFITMDGADFFAILEERVRLDDLLRRKKRHANETGQCFFPAQMML